MQAKQPRVSAGRLSVPPGSVASMCNHFIRGAAHGNTSSRERLHFPVQPALTCVPASGFSTYLLRELLRCHRSFPTRHCPVHRRCPRGAARAPASPRLMPPLCALRPPPPLTTFAPLMLPSAGPRGAHTVRSDRPCGTTTDGPDPAPTRRSAVASAHPKPGYQRGQARACHFHAGYARPIYLLFRRPHCC